MFSFWVVFCVSCEWKRSISTSDQNNEISGKLTYNDSEAISGVSILVQGTTLGSITDFDGNYSFDVSADVILVFSFVGIKSQEIQISGKTINNVVMQQNAIGLEEVVAIGYCTAKKSDLTGAVANADIESYKEQPNASIVQSLQGTVSESRTGPDYTSPNPDVSTKNFPDYNDDYQDGKTNTDWLDLIFRKSTE